MKKKTSQVLITKLHTMNNLYSVNIYLYHNLWNICSQKLLLSYTLCPQKNIAKCMNILCNC